jgi:hypothetical protein
MHAYMHDSRWGGGGGTPKEELHQWATSGVQILGVGWEGDGESNTGECASNLNSTPNYILTVFKTASGY